MLSLILVLYALQLVTAQNICFNFPGASTRFTNNPTSCSAWIACQNGKVVNTGSCDQGYNFNANTANCSPASSSKCTTSPLLNVCSGKLDGSYVANPQNCKGYIYCKQNVGFPGLCENKFIFNTTLNRCIEYPNYVCPSGGGSNLGYDGSSGNNVLCDYFPDGTFLANPTGCANYYVCQNGKLSSASCSSPYYFDPITGRCDHSRNVQCPSEVALLPSKNATEICSAIYGDGQFAGDPDSCNGYYYCPDGRYSTTTLPGKCPNDLYFDTISSTCSKYAQCFSRPCSGKPVGYFDNDPHDCRSYYYCDVDGIGSGRCPDGYEFDLKKQNCNLPDVVNCKAVIRPTTSPATLTPYPTTRTTPTLSTSTTSISSTTKPATLTSSPTTRTTPTLSTSTTSISSTTTPATLTPYPTTRTTPTLSTSTTPISSTTIPATLTPYPTTRTTPTLSTSTTSISSTTSPAISQSTTSSSSSTSSSTSSGTHSTISPSVRT